MANVGIASFVAHGRDEFIDHTTAMGTRSYETGIAKIRKIQIFLNFITIEEREVQSRWILGSPVLLRAFLAVERSEIDVHRDDHILVDLSSRGLKENLNTNLYRIYIVQNIWKEGKDFVNLYENECAEVVLRCSDWHSRRLVWSKWWWNRPYCRNWRLAPIYHCAR